MFDAVSRRFCDGKPDLFDVLLLSSCSDENVYGVSLVIYRRKLFLIDGHFWAVPVSCLEKFGIRLCFV